MKFPTPTWIEEIRANQKTIWKCYALSLTKVTKEPFVHPSRLPNKPTTKEKGKVVLSSEVIDLRDEILKNHPRPSDEMVAITSPYVDNHTVNICASLPNLEKEVLTHFQFINKDFLQGPQGHAWNFHNIICYSLNIDGCPDIIHKKRVLGQEPQHATNEEVEKLLATDFIFERPSILAGSLMWHSSNKLTKK